MGDGASHGGLHEQARSRRRASRLSLGAEAVVDDSAGRDAAAARGADRLCLCHLAWSVHLSADLVNGDWSVVSYAVSSSEDAACCVLVGHLPPSSPFAIPQAA